MLSDTFSRLAEEWSSCVTQDFKQARRSGCHRVSSVNDQPPIGQHVGLRNGIPNVSDTEIQRNLTNSKQIYLNSTKSNGMTYFAGS